MSLGPLTVCFYYWQLKPLAVADRLVIQGQYFALNKGIQISGDPSQGTLSANDHDSEKALYFVPGLRVRDKDTEAVTEDPLIEFSPYDDKTSSITVTATGTTRPLRVNNEFKNITALAQRSEIVVGNLHLVFVKHWRSIEFIVDGNSYLLSWPRVGESVSFHNLLCGAGLNGEAKVLTQLWLVRSESGPLGLVNGNVGESANTLVTVDGKKLESKWTFEARNQDSLIYGTGRRAITLKLQIDPAKKQIYLIPEKPLDFPLYRDPTENANPEIQAFLSSGPNISTPAYQLALGKKNQSLVNAAIKYSFYPEVAANAASEADRSRLKEIYQKGFILNNGLSQTAHKFGDTALVGSSESGVLLNLVRKEVSARQLVLIVLLIWSVAMVLFGFYGGIEKENYLFLLMPLVHFLLAIRMILSYRGYILPPNLSESYEKALIASIFVPFAIFVWLSPKALSDPFDFIYTDSERKRFSRDWYRAWMELLQRFISIPAFIYMLVCLLLICLVSGLWNGLPWMLAVLAFFVGSIVAAKLLAAANRDPDKNPLLDWIGNQRTLDIWILFVVPPVLAIVLNSAGLGAESLPLVALRAELIYLPFLLLAACRLYGRFFRLHFGLVDTIRWFDYLYLLVPVGVYFLQALIVGDFGFLIYSVPVCFLALVITWRAEQGWSGWRWLDRRVLLQGPLLYVWRRLDSHIVSYFVLFLSLALVALLIWAPFFTEKISGAPPFKGTSAQIRLLAFGSTGRLQDIALQAKDEPRETISQKLWHVLGWGATPNQCDSGSNARRTLETHEHFWTMFHFAARGARGTGYGSAPIGRVPFPNGIAQSDNTYSIYVMSEHGSLGGLAVISIYLAFGFLLLFVLTQHFAGDVEAALLVAGISLTVVFAAFYHAAGNVGAVPFTGRNLPLLSLNSNADILLVAFLLAIALSIISNHGEDLRGDDKGIYQSFKGQGNALNKWIGVIAVLLLIFFGATAVKTSAVANDAGLRSDYDLDQFIAVTQNHLSANDITWDPVKKEIQANESTPGLAKGQYLPQLIQKFNAAKADDKESGRYFFKVRNPERNSEAASPLLPPVPAKRSARDSCDLNQTSDDDTSQSNLTVSKNYFRRPSPFSTRTAWRGGLRSSDSANGDQDYLSGNGVALFFTHLLDRDDPIPGGKPTPIEIQPPGKSSFTTEYSRRFSVSSVKVDQVSSALFDVYAIEGDTVLEPKVQNSVHINGNAVSAKRVRLDDGDVVTVGESSPGAQSFTFFYHRAASSAILANRWVNGREEFYYPQGEAFALARSIAETISAQVGRTSQAGQAAAANRSLTLSIDAALNYEIYKLVAEEGKNLWLEVKRTNLAHDEPRVAVTAMNPLTGEILALASWPSFDPNHRPLEDEEADQRSYRNLLKQNNQLLLLNHNFTRHLMGSAVKPFIASTAATLHPELLKLRVDDTQTNYDNVFGIKTGTGDLAWHSFGKGQYDWQNFLVHSDNLYEVMLGFLGITKPGPIQFTKNPNKQDFWLGEEKKGQPDFTGVFESSGKAVDLAHSPLASTLSEFFDIRTSGTCTDYMTNVWQEGRDLLPEEGNSLNFISPEIPNLQLDRVASARDFVSVCLGGGENRWSNVKSAESFSRLVTGRRVVATMLKPDSKPTFEPFVQLNSEVRDALLQGLRGVAEPGGTASKLVSQINSIRQDIKDDRFTIFAKTGTLAGQYPNGRNDSNIILIAGVWNPTTKELENSVALSVYVQMGNPGGDSGRATALAGRILEILRARGQWAGKK